MGVKDFAVTSDGRRMPNPRHLERKARDLARYQRRLARCQNGSANRAKAKAKVARAHRKVRNARGDYLHRASARLVRENDVIVIEDLAVKNMVRNRRLARKQKGSTNRARAAATVARAHRKVRCARQDFLHKASTGLVRSADAIVIEDLAVKNMVRNRRLARAISDCGWGEFRRQLAYKCQRYGRELIVTDRWYPSSKTCSACGHLLAELSLSTRHWTCPACRARHDRDINAAKNILAAGLAAARDAPGDACGADVRHSGSSRVQSAVKQEPQPATAGIPVLQGGE